MHPEIAMLSKYLDELEKGLETLCQLGDSDLIPSDAVHEPTEVERKAYELARLYGLDGSVFTRQRKRHEQNWSFCYDITTGQIKVLRELISVHGLKLQQENAPPPPLMLSVRDLAHLLNLGESTVRQHDRRGLLPQPTRLQGRLLWNRSEIEKWIDAGSPPRQVWTNRRKARS